MSTNTGGDSPPENGTGDVSASPTPDIRLNQPPTTYSSKKRRQAEKREKADEGKGQSLLEEGEPATPDELHTEVIRFRKLWRTVIDRIHSSQWREHRDACCSYILTYEGGAA